MLCRGSCYAREVLNTKLFEVVLFERSHAERELMAVLEGVALGQSRQGDAAD